MQKNVDCRVRHSRKFIQNSAWHLSSTPGSGDLGLAPSAARRALPPPRQNDGWVASASPPFSPSLMPPATYPCKGPLLGRDRAGQCKFRSVGSSFASHTRMGRGESVLMLPDSRRSTTHKLCKPLLPPPPSKKLLA